MNESLFSDTRFFLYKEDVYKEVRLKFPQKLRNCQGSVEAESILKFKESRIDWVAIFNFPEWAKCAQNGTKIDFFDFISKEGLA